MRVDGWTGGQYSLWRAGLAIAVAWAAMPWIGSPESVVVSWLAAACLALAVPLALGWRDRWAAIALAVAVVAATIDVGAPGLLLALLLTFHACSPRAPFGSFEARDRVDPRGDWRRPPRIGTLAWTIPLVLLGVALFFGVLDLVLAASLGREAVGEPVFDLGDPWALAYTVLTFVLLGIGRASPARRPAAWIAIALSTIATAFATGVTPGDFEILLLILLAADPAWWPGRSLATAAATATASESIASGGARAIHVPARLFYDGDCGFCHRSVRFVLSEERSTPEALRLRFAPLGSDTFRARLAAHPDLDPATLPDSIVLELEDGSIRTRSAAALEIASRLGGIWRLLALMGNVLPKGLLDAGYDGIARIRKKLFAAPKDACPILPPDLRARFDG